MKVEPSGYDYWDAWRQKVADAQEPSFGLMLACAKLLAVSVLSFFYSIALGIAASKV